MSWTRSYTFKTVKVFLDDSGVIGFDIEDEDSETVKAIKTSDPIIFEALNAAIREYPEIAIVNNIMDATFEYFVEQRLKYADEETLEEMGANLKVFINSRYAPENLKGEAKKWLDQVLDKLTNRRRIRVKKEKAAKTFKGGYIYLVKADTGHYKIGRTKSIPDRINFFTIKLPFEIELVHHFQADDMRKAEAELHEKYKAQRVNGEWFTLTDEDVTFIKSI